MMTSHQFSIDKVTCLPLLMVCNVHWCKTLAIISLVCLASVIVWATAALERTVDTFLTLTGVSTIYKSSSHLRSQVDCVPSQTLKMTSTQVVEVSVNVTMHQQFNLELLSSRQLHWTNYCTPCRTLEDQAWSLLSCCQETLLYWPGCV